MSWDVMILNREGTPERLEDVPKDWMPRPMGAADTVRDAIRRTLPSADWSDPGWGIFDGDGFSITFNFQETGTVDAFTLHIRGGGDPLSTIVRLCRENDWAAYDYSNGEMIDLDDRRTRAGDAFKATGIVCYGTRGRSVEKNSEVSERPPHPTLRNR